MAYQPAPGIHVAMIGDHAIILNEHSDRYTKLDSGLSHALQQCLAATPVKTAADRIARLEKMGLIVPAAEAADPGAAPPAATHSIDQSLGPTGPLRPFATALRLAAARRRLRVQGLAQTLADARQRATRCWREDENRAAAIACNFHASRGWLPFARACLPDSLALHAMMCRQSVRTTLIIGVRDYPFSAHCWVQAGALVLTDPLDDIHALVPILAL